MRKKPTTSIHDELLDNGKIFLFGDINEKITSLTLKKLNYLLHRKHTDVKIYINSDGGELECALAIIDEIAGLSSLNVDVTTIAIGKAYSSAALILAHGIKRYATENSAIMFHPISYILQDYHNHNSSYTTFADRVYKKMMKDLAKRCGYKTNVEVRNFINKIKETFWLTTDDAIKSGVIDGVWDFTWEIK